MYIAVNLNDFPLPQTVTYDCDYAGELYKYLDNYSTYIQEKIGKEYPDTIKTIDSNIVQTKKCILSYYNGKISEAYNCIKNILEQYVDSPFVVAPVDKNYAFRGSAVKELRPKIYSNEKYDPIYDKMLNHDLSFYRARTGVEIIQEKDMFHIPFNKRGIINTQRFSSAGLPCLYLSTSSFGAWLELGLPEAEYFQVSSFKIPKNLKVLNLCIQQHLINGMSSYIENDYEKNIVLSSLEIFPLIIATSYHVSETDRKFKSEYIISQIIMQVCNELDIDGVAYLSKRMLDYYAYPQAINLAIAIPYNEKCLYWQRANEILLTKPIRFSDFLRERIDNNIENQNFNSYVNEIYKDGEHNEIVLAGNIEKYTMTKHSAFDEYLLKQEFYNFSEICK